MSQSYANTFTEQEILPDKGTDQQTYERFDTEDLAADDDLLRRFVFLLAAERVAPATGRCHFDDLRAESEQVGKDLTKEFYLRYAEMRQGAFTRLCRDNPGVPRHDVLTCAQKLLDRVLFGAFCEDRGLLPGESHRRFFQDAAWIESVVDFRAEGTALNQFGVQRREELTAAQPRVEDRKAGRKRE